MRSAWSAPFSSATATALRSRSFTQAGAAARSAALAPHVFVEELSVRSIAAAKVAYETTTLRERLARYHDDVDGAFWGWNNIWLDPAFRAWNIEDCLPGVTSPTLVIQGADDE